MYFILILILILYSILSFIVGKRIYRSINSYKYINSQIYWIIFTIISTSFIFYEFTNKYFPHIINTILSFIGSYYLSFLLYTLILFPIAFLLTKILKPKNFDFYLSSLVIVFLIISTGTYLSLSPYVNNYEIHVWNSRASLNDLTANLDSSKLSIVIDHNPSKIYESADNNIDLQVSGHTHKGQVFPGNLITKSLFPLDYGYGQFNNTNLVVSSGFGTWGPMIRTNSRSEIVSIKLKN